MPAITILNIYIFYGQKNNIQNVEKIAKTSLVNEI
jgi:hypothetical protein